MGVAQEVKYTTIITPELSEIFIRNAEFVFKTESEWVPDVNSRNIFVGAALPLQVYS